jgi:hypothetical protein
MSNIPADSHSTQSILVFHQELASLFESSSVKDKFVLTMQTQNAFMSESRKDLTPLLIGIDNSQCLVVELWIEDGVVFDGNYHKTEISSLSYCDFDFFNVLVHTKREYSNFIPVVFIFREPNTEKHSHLSFNLDLIEKPFNWGVEIQKTAKPKPSKPKEQDLERELLEWLFSHGIQADNQVTSSNHRTDIWIPSKCFLELKRDKVTGDDICQAIDYCVSHKMPIVVVGNNITNMASRGITAFNKAIDADLICFVQWSAIKVYLKGLLGLK